MSSTIPPGVDLSQDRRTQVYVAEITVFPVAVIAVILRLVARRVSKTRLWLDDWFILISFVFATAAFSIVMLWLKAGAGQHIEVVVAANPNAPNHLLKEVFAAGFIYPWSIAFARYSILAFYWRIFRVSRSIHLPIYVITGINTAWFLTFIITTSVECIPTASLWNPTVKGHCINLAKFYIGMAVPNVIVDLFLLVLPLPYIWKLQIKTSQKVLVAGAFIMGGLTCVISIVRLAFIANLDLTDLTWGGTNLLLYTGLETYFAVICACLPSLRPLSKLFTGSTTVKRSNPSSYALRWSRKNRPSDPIDRTTGSWTHLHEDAFREPVAPLTTTARGWKEDGSQSFALKNLGPEEINVTTEVTWQEGMV